jgi:hypothetical protein
VPESDTGSPHWPPQRLITGEKRSSERSQPVGPPPGARRLVRTRPVHRGLPARRQAHRVRDIGHPGSVANRVGGHDAARGSGLAPCRPDRWPRQRPLPPRHRTAAPRPDRRPCPSRRAHAPAPPRRRHPIAEMAKHASFTFETGIPIYFCDRLEAAMRSCPVAARSLPGGGQQNGPVVASGGARCDARSASGCVLPRSAPMRAVNSASINSCTATVRISASELAKDPSIVAKAHPAPIGQTRSRPSCVPLSGSALLRIARWPLTSRGP